MGVSSTCIYQMVWWWNRGLDFIVKIKRIVLHNNAKFNKNLHPEHLRALSMIISNGYCLGLMTLFSWRELLIQHTPLSSFLKDFKWIQGTGWGIECTGLAFGSMSMWTFYVDKYQEFHQTSFYFPIALRASLLFDVHLDEWVLSWPQLHLSFHTWHPESLLQSIWVNLCQRACLWRGC